MSMRKKSMRKKLADLLLALALGFSVVNAADAPQLGQPITSRGSRALGHQHRPDGVGLPPGSGTPAQGAAVYAERGCAALPRREGGRRAGRGTGGRWSAQQH